MPHLSPILWITLFSIVWISFILSIVTIEYTNPSLNR